MSNQFLNGSSTSLVTGGIPTTSQDVAPSVVYLIAYLGTAALTFFRLFQYRDSKTLLLTYLRLALFELTRIATFIVSLLSAKNFSDATKGNGSFDTNYLIAEQILVGVGFVIPATTAVRLAELHTSRQDESGQKKTIFRIMEIALLIAVALGIVAGTEYNKALTDSGTRSQLKTFRIVSSILSLGVLAILVAYCFTMLSRRDLPRATTVWLMATAALLVHPPHSYCTPSLMPPSIQIIVPIYRLENILNPPSDGQSDAAKIVFYVVQLAPEWLVGLSLTAVNAQIWCGVLPKSTYQDSEEAYGLYSRQ
ncbi:hypothetical protein EWM64_g7164 [Hericium alpestre]|uniref:Uncharacterized protein n=1 Tax=Hericium alpestre TaxID=135208 RepID=A0A4Y9ZRI0_9AGAM|nr:hypothetical protein EWM64_g7164 [Hericium alpestre]